MAIFKEHTLRGRSSTAQKVREREGLIRTVGGNLPEKPKPKKSVLRRLSETLDALGGGVRTGIYASNEGRTFGEGFKEGFLNPLKRKAGADLLSQAGVENKYAKAIGGFVLDVALDPLSYVSFGAGGMFSRGAKIATKMGEVTLSGPGSKLLITMSKGGKKMVNGVERTIEGVGRPQAERTMATILERSPELAAKFVDPGGIKFAGASLVSGERTGRVVQALGIKMAQKWVGTTKMGKAGTAIAELVVPDMKLTNELMSAGYNQRQIGEIHKLRRVVQGDKAVAMANRKQYLAENFKKLVDVAPELGIHGNATQRATRVSEGLTVLRGLDDIKNQYGKTEWLAVMRKLPEKQQQKYLDALKFKAVMDGTTAPKALQEVYDDISKTYDDIADVDFMNGFINSKRDFYAYRGTRRVAETVVGKGKGKYGVDKTAAHERTFESLLEIDLAKNWEAEWDFLKGVTIRGFQSDANVANKAFLNKMAKLAGVPITKFTPKHQIKALEHTIRDTLGEAAVDFMQQSGIQSIEDIAKMTPASFAKVFADLPIDRFNSLDVPQGLLVSRNKAAGMLANAEQQALDLSPRPIQRIIKLRQVKLKQIASLEDEIAVRLSDEDAIVRTFDTPGIPQQITRARDDILNKINGFDWYKQIKKPSEAMKQLIRLRARKLAAAKELNESLTLDMVDNAAKNRPGEKELRGLLGEIQRIDSGLLQSARKDAEQGAESAYDALASQLQSVNRQASRAFDNAINQKGKSGAEKFIQSTRSELSNLTRDVERMDKALIVEGYAAQVNKIRGLEKTVRDADKTIKQKLLQPLVKESKKLMEGTVDSIPSGWIDAASLRIPGMQGQFSGLRIPAELGKDLTAVGSIFANPEDMAKLLGGLEEYVNIWKSMMTVYFPGYHMRNAIGNIFNASYLGGAHMGNFKTAADIQKLATQAPDIANGVKGWDTVIEGLGMTAKEVMEEATRQGIRGFGQTTQTLTGKAGRETLDSLVGRSSVRDKIAQGQLGSWKIRAVGDALEDNAKIGLFIDRLKKGDSLEDAGMYVKKFLFDYGDLTPLERDVFKRVIPFYTWTRKNMPLQIQQAMRTPGKITNLQRGLDAAERFNSSGYTTEERTLLPDWVSQGLGVKLTDAQGGVIKTLVGLGLPIEDLNKLDKPGRELLISLTPPMKFLLEEISGKDFYRQKSLDEPAKISKVTGEYLTKNLSKDTQRLLGIEKRTTPYGTTYYSNARVTHVLAQLPISRLGSTIDRMTDDSKDAINKVLGYVVGMNMYDVDLKQARYFRDKDRLDQLDKEVERLKRAGKLGEIERLFIPKKN